MCMFFFFTLHKFKCPRKMVENKYYKITTSSKKVFCYEMLINMLAKISGENTALNCV